MKVGELCAGYNGISLGLQLAGEDVDLRWLSEIDPALDPIHPAGVPNLGDMKLIDWSAVEPVDLLTAGFPCQPVSAAGRQLAQADERWLWPEVHRAITTLKPPRVLLENVRNLISIQKGAVWAYILDDLATLGYDVQWLTLGACRVGAAHHRHRVFALAQAGHVGRSPQAQRLEVQECGAKRGAINVLPSPSAVSYGSNQGGAAGRVGPVRHSLESLARLDLLPTPQAQNSTTGATTTRGTRRADEPNGLAGVGALLPSPQSRDGQGRGTPNATTAQARIDSGRRNLDDALALLPTPAARDGDGRGEGDQTYWAMRGAERETVVPLGAALALLPTPRATDGVNGGPGQRGSSGDLAMSSAVQPEHWGRFADAVARHAAAFDAPPAPTEPNRNGAPRLTAAFAEWLMCLPAGHVTAKLPRTAALKAIGNGVCPPQLAAAWQLLTNLDRPSDMSLESHGMTTSTSSTVDEIQQRNATARGRVINATMALGITVDPALIEAALMELAQVWTDEAQYFTEQKRRGWKSTSEELTRCAARLRGFAVGLTTRDVQVPPEPAVAKFAVPPPDNKGGGCGDPNCDFQVQCGKCFEASERQYDEWFARAGRPRSMHRLVIDEMREQAHADAVKERQARPAEILGGAMTAENPEQLMAFMRGETDDPGVVHAVRGGIQFPIAEPLTADNFLPEPPPVEHHAGEIVTVPAVDNPFTSPAAPGTNRAPVKRLGYGELGPLIAATYPVPRPHLSHSFVESTERCGLSALLSDASKLGHLGPRRPSWSLLGGSAFHLAIESIERTAIEVGGTSPLTTAFADVASDWEKFWNEVLASKVDEQKAALVGTAYADPSTWHIANKQLEGFDWWRVEGLNMIKRYLEFHDNEWRSKHTLLQVPQDPTAPQPNRVPVLEFGFNVTAGSTAIPDKGFIDAAWLSTTDEYPTATLEVVDYKAGKSVPSDHFQLTQYADVLRRYLPPGFALPIVGRYWLARQGRYTPPVKLEPAAAQAEIDYRYTMANRKVAAGVFEPSPSNFCASCSSVDYCPAQSMRDAASTA